MISYLDAKITDMRRLSRGAKVVVTIMDESGGELIRDFERFGKRMIDYLLGTDI